MLIRNFLISLYVLLFSTNCFACKEAALNETFPIKDFNGYDTIVIAKITKTTENTESQYGGFLSFTAKVQEKIKGSLSVNSIILGEPSTEQPRAVCPTNLMVDSTYLLLLNKNGETYNLSRFSFPTNSLHPYYLKYINEIKSVVNGS